MEADDHNRALGVLRLHATDDPDAAVHRPQVRSSAIRIRTDFTKPGHYRMVDQGALDGGVHDLLIHPTRVTFINDVCTHTCCRVPADTGRNGS